MMPTHRSQEVVVRISLGLAALVLLVVASRRAPAQEPVVALQRHAVYLEVGGNASRYSINYERAFNARHRLRVGGAIWTDGESAGGGITETELNFPIMYNLLFRRGAHHLELGAGVLVGAWDEQRGTQTHRATYWSATATVGYRHQLPANGWLIRVGFTPIYGFGADEDAYPRKGFASRFGISVGLAFN